jgi:hypothetical protein
VRSARSPTRRLPPFCPSSIERICIDIPSCSQVKTHGSR